MNRQVCRVTSWLIALVLAGVMPTFSISKAQTSSPPDQKVVVSMIQLLSHPEKYEGKRILTYRFLNMQPKREYHLYLHEEDYKYALMNGMVLRLTEAQHKQFEKLNLKYVMIAGTVHAGLSGRDEGFSGEMVDITRMAEWGDWSKVPVY